jgi:hypothetical protein
VLRWLWRNNSKHPEISGRRWLFSLTIRQFCYPKSILVTNEHETKWAPQPASIKPWPHRESNLDRSLVYHFAGYSYKCTFISHMRHSVSQTMFAKFITFKVEFPAPFWKRYPWDLKMWLQPSSDICVTNYCFVVPTSVYNARIFFGTIHTLFTKMIVKMSLKYIYNMFRPHWVIVR